MKVIMSFVFSLFYLADLPGQNNAPPAVEQLAFEYFILSLDSTPIYCDDFKKFDKDSHTVYFRPNTFTPAKLKFDYAAYSQKPGFIALKKDEDKNSYMYADTAEYPLSATGEFLKPHTGKLFPGDKCEGDILVAVSSRIFYNRFYYVRIYIDVGVNWKSNEAIVKLDETGAPLDILFRYGDS